MSEESWERFKRDVFPKALAIACHQDLKNSWPVWKRFLHWALVSWRCPCCIEERKR